MISNEDFKYVRQEDRVCILSIHLLLGDVFGGGSSSHLLGYLLRLALLFSSIVSMTYSACKANMSP